MKSSAPAGLNRKVVEYYEEDHGSVPFRSVYDGLHAADRFVVKLVPLNPGYYPLLIKYFEKTGDQTVIIGTVDKNLKPVPLKKEMFFHR